jgi:hypothetical protein
MDDLTRKPRIRSRRFATRKPLKPAAFAAGPLVRHTSL